MPPVPHPLNQAVVLQALHDLRNGQLRRCLSLGFAEDELEMLKQPELASLLINARIPWCKVTVNRETLRCLAEQARDGTRETGVVDRQLRLGASSEMICKRFGLTHQEVALRRDILGLPRRRGRFPTLSEAQEAELWRAWLTAVEGGIAQDDEDALLAWATDLAEARDWSLAVIWMTVQNWIAQGDAQEAAQEAGPGAAEE
jgi:hypothetical protein